MALFGSSKKKTAAPAKDAAAKKAPKAAKTKVAKEAAAPVVRGTAPITADNLKHSYGDIILAPHITEKGAVVATTSNAYVFRIHQDADSRLVAKAVEAIYGIKPVKVNIVRNPAKKVIIRGTRGVRNARSKAYVYLKKGDKIELV